MSALVAGAAMLSVSGAEAGFIRSPSLFDANTLSPNDDGSTGQVSLGFTINFAGLVTDKTYVNNNGNVTFGSPLRSYTPTGITAGTRPTLAPFWADVDTRGARSQPVRYGTAILDGRNAFGVNWIDVGYFSHEDDKLNSFQLVLIDRSDTGAGNFDFEFNYGRILWETGSASGGSNGFGGASAHAGFTNGQGFWYEFVGSGVNGALLDSGPNALVRTRLGSTQDGNDLFQVRNGTIIVPPIDPPVNDVPEPGSLALAAGALAALALRRRRG